MENPGVLNILKFANAVQLRAYRPDRDRTIWTRASLKHMDDINGTNTIDVADVDRDSDALELLIEILKSSDTDWMKYDSPGQEEWYVLPSLLEGKAG